MTDPTGRSFLSYRRARLEEARLLVQAQHDLGIPTWQDVDDLVEAQTETELRRVLGDPTTAGAILWLTPEVAGSPTIRTVEAPEIARRAEAGDGFFLVPVAAGGLGYAAAAAVVNDRLGVLDLSSWNMLVASADPAGPEECRRVAERVLRRRLAAVHRALPPGEALRIRLMTRRRPGFEPGWALSLDWSAHFDHRSARGDAWAETLLPALRTVREAIRREAPGRAVEASGAPTLSAGFALGRAFLSLDRDLRLAWRQEAPERPDQLWSLAAPREEVACTVETRPVRTDGEALALLLSVTRDVAPVFGASKGELPPFRAAVELRAEGATFAPLVLETPGQAASVVNRTIEAVRRAGERYQTTGLHVFGAIPVGLAVLLGQRLNTLGPVRIYEHDEAAGRYHPELLLPADL